MAGWLDSIFGGGDTPPDPNAGGGGLGMLSDPRIMALLGAGAGIAKGAQPYMSYSRLPQSAQGLRAGAIGGLAEGLAGGIQSGLDVQNKQQALQEKILGTATQLYRIDAGQSILRNQPPPPFDLQKYLPMAKNIMSGQFGTQPQPVPAEGIIDREQPPPQLGGALAQPAAAPPPRASGPGPIAAPGGIPTPPLAPEMSPGTASMPGTGMPVASAVAPPPQQPPQPMPGAVPTPMQQPPMAPQPPAGGTIAGVPSSTVSNAYGMDLLFPGSGKDIISKQFPGPLDQQRLVEYAKTLPPGPLRDALMAKASDLKPSIGGERPGVPLRFYNATTGQYSTQPGEEDISRRFANIQQGAILGREMALRNQDYLLKTGQSPPGSRTIEGGPGVAMSSTLPAAPAPTAAPAKDAPPTPQVAAITGRDYTTDRGTVIPSPRAQTLKQGETAINLQQTASQKTQDNWDNVRSQIDTTRARVLSTAEVLAQTQSGGLNEARAIASQRLSGMGLDYLAGKVMRAEDRAGVQKILWNSMQESLAYLKTANAGTGGRILNSEFNAFLEHGYSPDMEPGALREGMKQLLGGAYQTGNMIDDWLGPAQKMGWQDANQYQSNYLRKNPLEGFIAYADKELPTFKGQVTSTPFTKEQIDAEIARRKALKAGAQ